MIRIERQIEIAASPENVFDLICDLHRYDRWLPSVGDYEGTDEISPPPVAVGTTYVEHSTVALSVAATAGGARVMRTVELGVPRRLALVRSIVVRRYALESERMLQALKAHAER